MLGLCDLTSHIPRSWASSKVSELVSDTLGATGPSVSHPCLLSLHSVASSAIQGRRCGKRHGVVFERLLHFFLGKSLPLSGLHLAHLSNSVANPVATGMEGLLSLRLSPPCRRMLIRGTSVLISAFLYPGQDIQISRVRISPLENTEPVVKHIGKRALILGSEGQSPSRHLSHSDLSQATSPLPTLVSLPLDYVLGFIQQCLPVLNNQDCGN